jgi:hypothetical protein
MESPAQTLPEALARMTCSPEPEPMGLVGWSGEDLGAGEFQALLAQEGPLQVVREGGEITVLVPWQQAQDLLQARPSAQIAGPLTWIRFETPMAWELVGFLAHITGALAAAGISIGAVCGFSRDHLFVPQELGSEALRVLAELGIREAPLNASLDDGSACCD